MAVLQAQHAFGEVGERIEHAAEHPIEDAEGQRIEHEPYKRERGEIMPGLGDLIGRFADDNDGIGVIDGDDPHSATDELRPHEPGKPPNCPIAFGTSTP